MTAIRAEPAGRQNSAPCEHPQPVHEYEHGLLPAGYRWTPGERFWRNGHIAPGGVAVVALDGTVHSDSRPDSDWINTDLGPLIEITRVSS